jgi:hypothetical protein
MGGCLELDGGSGLRDLAAEEKIEGFAAPGIDENVATFFDCILDAA